VKKLPQTESCFVCGKSNSNGLRLQFLTDGDRVYADFNPAPHFAGFKSILHGGITSTVLDEIMVWAIGVRCKCFAYCADLRVRFRIPVEPEKSYRLEGWLETERRMRMFEARARVLDSGGNVAAEASGKYMALDGTQMAAMLEDFPEAVRSQVFGAS
jgi:acyl-coenzyme A thioesterase PaaI-like protein